VFSEDRVLSEVAAWCREKGFELKALVLFGSAVYNSVKARDIDLLVVDKLENPGKALLHAAELAARLRRALGKPFDVVLLDTESLRENAQPGTVVSGLALGFKVLYDAVGFSKLVEEMLRSLTTTDYRYFKEGRWIDLSIAARVKMKLDALRENCSARSPRSI